MHNFSIIINSHHHNVHTSGYITAAHTLVLMWCSHMCKKQIVPTSSDVLIDYVVIKNCTQHEFKDKVPFNSYSWCRLVDRQLSQWLQRTPIRPAALLRQSSSDCLKPAGKFQNLIRRIEERYTIFLSSHNWEQWHHQHQQRRQKQQQRRRPRNKSIGITMIWTPNIRFLQSRLHQ